MAATTAPMARPVSVRRIVVIIVKKKFEKAAEENLYAKIVYFVIAVQVNSPFFQHK
jgi:hypothetical protein